AVGRLDHGVVVDDGGAIVDGADVCFAVEVLARSLSQLSGEAKIEVAPIQAEIEVHIHVPAVEGKSPDERIVKGARGQGSPAAVLAAAAPNDPGRSPHPV